jgi:hypothetical protein
LQNPKNTPPPTRVETKDERKERKVSVHISVFYIKRLTDE